VNYRTSRGGTGLVQPVGSTKSQVVASADDKKFTPAINFGFEELHDDFSKNEEDQAAQQRLDRRDVHHRDGEPRGLAPYGQSEQDRRDGQGGQGRRRRCDAQRGLRLPRAARARSRKSPGLVTFTPATATDNAGVVLRVPYYLVPRARADISTKLGSWKAPTRRQSPKSRTRRA
jgi:hypothetical protein